MASRQFHFKGFSIVKGDVKVNIDLSRFQGQYRDAQYALDSAVMASMTDYMPKQDSNFVKVTKSMSDSLAGTGTVIAAAPPQGRYLYEGKTMVDELTGSPWARKDAKKVLVNQYTGHVNVKEDLNLTAGNSKATPHWFDTAKENHGDEWVKVVKRIAGGGSK